MVVCDFTHPGLCKGLNQSYNKRPESPHSALIHILACFTEECVH